MRFPAVQADRDFLLQRGKISFQDFVKIDQFAVAVSASQLRRKAVASRHNKSKGFSCFLPKLFLGFYPRKRQPIIKVPEGQVDTGHPASV
jgi:hypothetical protein